MKDIDEEKTTILEEGPPFSDQDVEDHSEAEEEAWEEEDAPRRSRRSLFLVGLLCVVFGILALVIISFMKLSVNKPVLIGERIRVRITSPGSIFEEKKPTVSESSESSVIIEERDLGDKKVFILQEKEVATEEKGVKVAEREGKRPEIEEKEEDKPQVAMVGEAKGPAKSAGTPPEGRYTVNIASFRTRVRAERLTKELEDKGFEPFIEKADIPKKGTWYRVAVGRFSSRGEALHFAQALREKGIKYSFVRKLRETAQ